MSVAEDSLLFGGSFLLDDVGNCWMFDVGSMICSTVYPATREGRPSEHLEKERRVENKNRVTKLGGATQVSVGLQSPISIERYIYHSHQCGGYRTVFSPLKPTIPCACQRKLPFERLNKLFKIITEKRESYHSSGTLCRSTSLFIPSHVHLLLQLPGSRSQHAVSALP